MAEGLLGLVLANDVDVSVQLRWARRLADARRLDVVVFEPVEAQENRVSEVDFGNLPSDRVQLRTREVMVAMKALPGLLPGSRPEDDDADKAARNEAPDAVYVRLIELHHTGLSEAGRQLVAETRRLKLKLVTSVGRDLDVEDPAYLRERRRFLRMAPCDVIFGFGFDDQTRFERILAGVATGSHGSAALRLGRDLAEGGHAALTAIRVNPSVGPDAEGVGNRRTDTVLKRALGDAGAHVNRRIVVSNSVPGGIRDEWERGEHDLVILGASHHGLTSSRIAGSIGRKLIKGAGPAVLIVCRKSPVGNRFVGLVESVLERFVPQVDRESRIALVDRVQSSSHWDFDFFALMMLSAIIAAVGLIQDSAAVIIGAMLVAPLMTPILGLGLALVQGNAALAVYSFRAIVFGVGVAIGVAAVVGVATPGFEEPTREILGRGEPGILDLFVAFASGVAAAYASCRPGLLAALPGVAIAAALVPPLASSGLALSLGNWFIAGSALLLFIINMVTIILATMITLWVVGVRNIRRTSSWIAAGVSAVLVSVVVLAAVLEVEPPPNVEPADMTPDFVSALERQLGDEYELHNLAVAYDELGVQLNVTVSGDRFLPAALADEIREVARDRFDRPVRVRLLTEIVGVAGPG